MFHLGFYYVQIVCNLCVFIDMQTIFQLMKEFNQINSLYVLFHLEIMIIKVYTKFRAV